VETLTTGTGKDTAPTLTEAEVAGVFGIELEAEAGKSDKAAPPPEKPKKRAAVKPAAKKKAKPARKTKRQSALKPSR
jgi:hypothetical protein